MTPFPNHLMIRGRDNCSWTRLIDFIRSCRRRYSAASIIYSFNMPTTSSILYTSNLELERCVDPIRREEILFKMGTWYRTLNKWDQSIQALPQANEAMAQTYLEQYCTDTSLDIDQRTEILRHATDHANQFDEVASHRPIIPIISSTGGGICIKNKVDSVVLPATAICFLRRDGKGLFVLASVRGRRIGHDTEHTKNK